MLLFLDQPLASIRCEPSGRRTQGAGSDGGVFDIASFQELECGTSLRNVVRSSSPSQLPSKLEALTAQPEQLTEEEVTTATEILSNLQEELQDEDVSMKICQARYLISYITKICRLYFHMINVTVICLVKF